ncbi:MAG: SDR family oxidoreductase [Acidobacteria bacterium]|nr:SDR family oxidoreductase [Acidobacteriota bacterium]
MANRFEGKVVAVTGSGSGMGREVARMIAAEGGSVVVSDVIETRAKEAADLIQSEGGKAVGLKADVTSQDDMDLLVKTAVDNFGRLDAMHANAGVAEPTFGTTTRLHEVGAAAWDQIMNVNGRGIFLAFRSAVTQLLKQGSGGVLLATTSAAGSFIYPRFPLYAASKFAGNGITKAFAVEYGPQGIRANAMAPFHGMSPNLLMPADAPVLGKSYEEVGGPWDPAGNPGAMPLALPTPPTLRDNANLALFLLSDESRYISGEVIHSVSGATSARVAMNFGSAAAGDVVPEDVRAALDSSDK